MYQTRNVINPKIWIKRIFFTSLFFLIILSKLLEYIEFSTTDWIVVLCIYIYIFIIIIGQIDELTINDESIILEQKSIIPFLSSKKIINFSEIESYKRNSNYINNDGHWFVFLHRKNQELVINLKNNKYEIINGHLHPRGISGIIELIESNK